MSVQQKLIARWGAIGLVVSVSISILSVMNEGGFGNHEIDRFDIWNGEIIGYWIGRAGVFPFIAIIVAAAKTFRAAGILQSILNVTGAILCTAVVIGIGVVALAALLPVKDIPFASGRGREEFVTGVRTACVEKQKLAPTNRPTDAAISAFCDCYANEMAETTTASDVRNSKDGSPSQASQKRIITAWQKCSQPAQ